MGFKTLHVFSVDWVPKAPLACTRTEVGQTNGKTVRTGLQTS